jgi:hypothetical protein
MNPLESILHRAQKLISGGLARAPQDYLYLDLKSLHEHYQALTGTARIPRATVETASATLGAGLSFGLKGDLTGRVESQFELSNYHLFESMEPEMRERYAIARDSAGLEASLRSFAWLQGKLSWYHVGAAIRGDKVVGEAKLYYVLETAGSAVMLLCQDAWFSPFTPFFTEDTQFYRMEWAVEVLAYNPGILGQYGTDPHPRAPRSLAVVPTVILATDAGQREDIAAFIRKLNDGELSRSPRPWFRPERPTGG